MSVLPFKTYDVNELGESPLEEVFRRGEVCKIRLGSRLPEVITRLTQEILAEEIPNAVARSFVATSFNKPIRMSKISKRPGIEKNNAPNSCVLSVFDASRAIHKTLENLNIISGWKKFAASFWIGGSSPGFHFDGWDNILIQLSGKKHAIVYSPAVMSQIEKVNIFAKHQALGKLIGETEQKLDYYEGWLEPGETLIIPCGAMHALNGNCDSLSLNFFLDKGPKPRYLRYRYLYFWLLWWRERLSMLISREKAEWLEQRFNIRFFARYQRSMSAVPRTFPHTNRN